MKNVQLLPPSTIPTLCELFVKRRAYANLSHFTFQYQIRCFFSRFLCLFFKYKYFEFCGWKICVDVFSNCLRLNIMRSIHQDLSKLAVPSIFKLFFFGGRGGIIGARKSVIVWPNKNRTHVECLGKDASWNLIFQTEIGREKYEAAEPSGLSCLHSYLLCLPALADQAVQGGGVLSF